MQYKEVHKHIGRKIKRLREEKFPDKSRNLLAKKALTDYRIWHKLENGQYNFTLKFLQRIADVLEIEILDLFKIDSYAGDFKPGLDEYMGRKGRQHDLKSDN